MWKPKLSRISEYLAVLLAVLAYFVVGGSGKEVRGQACVVRDPYNGFEFDYNGLYRIGGYKYPLLGRNKTIYFNLCLPDIPLSRFNRSIYAYLETGTERSAILGFDEVLKWDEGRMNFDMEGEKCTETKNYSLSLSMMCSQEHFRHPIFITGGYPNDPCTFSGVWHNKHSCLPMRSPVVKECILRHPNGTVELDLNEAELEEMNVTKNEKEAFLISLCQPVPYGYRQMCPEHSNVCFRDDNAKDPLKRFRQYGVIEGIKKDNYGRYYMQYGSSEPCHEDSDLNYTSKVRLVCNQEQLYEAMVLEVEENCEKIFAMTTYLVCDKPRSCAVNDRGLGKKVNLKSLQNQTYQVERGNEIVYFGVCERPARCAPNQGACIMNATGSTTIMNLGAPSDAVRFNNSDIHGVYLEYLGGSHCKGDRAWTTLITFHCANPKETRPTLLEDTDCRFVISFPTPLVCEEDYEIQCFVESGGEFVDVSALKSSVGNYKALVSDELPPEAHKFSYYLQVCKPLVPQYGLHCPPGSAVCRAVEVDGKPEQEASLGYPDHDLSIHQSIARLGYYEGSQWDNCKFSTEIIFRCDPRAGRGLPILFRIIEECHHVFMWDTNVACPDQSIDFIAENCSFSVHEYKRNVSVSLRDVFIEGETSVRYGKDAFFAIELCQKTDMRAELNFPEGSLVMRFDEENHKLCDDEKPMKVLLELICSNSTTETILSEGDTCSLHIYQNTPAICPLFGVNDVVPSEPLFKRASEGLPWITILISLAVVLVAGGGTFHYFRDPQRRERVRSCFDRHRESSIHYTRGQNEDDDATEMLPLS